MLRLCLDQFAIRLCRAVKAARRAFDKGEWPRMSGKQRGQVRTLCWFRGRAAWLFAVLRRSGHECAGCRLQARVLRSLQRICSARCRSSTLCTAWRSSLNPPHSAPLTQRELGFDMRQLTLFCAVSMLCRSCTAWRS